MDLSRLVDSVTWLRKKVYQRDVETLATISGKQTNSRISVYGEFSDKFLVSSNYVIAISILIILCLIEIYVYIVNRQVETHIIRIPSNSVRRNKKLWRTYRPPGDKIYDEIENELVLKDRKHTKGSCEVIRSKSESHKFDTETEVDINSKQEDFNLIYVPKIFRTESGSIKNTSCAMKLTLYSEYLNTIEGLGHSQGSQHRSLSTCDFVAALRRHYTARLTLRREQSRAVELTTQQVTDGAGHSAATSSCYSANLVREIRSDLASIGERLEMLAQFEKVHGRRENLGSDADAGNEEADVAERRKCAVVAGETPNVCQDAGNSARPDSQRNAVSVSATSEVSFQNTNNNKKMATDEDEINKKLTFRKKQSIGSMTTKNNVKTTSTSGQRISKHPSSRAAKTPSKTTSSITRNPVTVNKSIRGSVKHSFLSKRASRNDSTAVKMTSKILETSRTGDERDLSRNSEVKFHRCNPDGREADCGREAETQDKGNVKSAMTTTDVNIRSDKSSESALRYYTNLRKQVGQE